MYSKDLAPSHHYHYPFPTLKQDLGDREAKEVSDVETLCETVIDKRRH
jgi:hypothetical protein